MHICYVCSEYPPAPHGGIGSFTQTLGRELVRHGQRVSVIGMYPGKNLIVDDDLGVRVWRVPHRGLPGIRFILNRLRFLKTLRQLHREAPVDIVEGGELDIALLTRRSPGLKLIRMHGGPTVFASQSRMQIIMERRSFRVAGRLCAVSEFIARETRAMLHLGDRPIEVIPNPVDVEAFRPSAEGEEENGLLVFAGTISERKGIRQLIQAMPRIVAECPEAHLEVYGGEVIDPPPAVPLAKTLSSSIAPEIAGKIRWMGRVARAGLLPALRRASVCLYPSHMEAMPIAWIEGMASGKAVLASQTGPGPEIIEDGVNGLLCNPSDAGSIAAQTIRLLKDAQLRKRLGEAARKSAVEKYSLDRIVARNIEYYRRLTGAA